MSFDRFKVDAPMSETWKEKVDAAYDMVHALCQPRGGEGSRQWIMSIPARPDYDPDLVITSGLRAASNEIRTLAAEVDELRGKLDDVRMGIGCARGQRSTQYCAEAAQRDEVITKLLDLYRPGCAPDQRMKDWDTYAMEYSEWEVDCELYRLACEIAGRTE